MTNLLSGNTLSWVLLKVPSGGLLASGTFCKTIGGSDLGLRVKIVVERKETYARVTR